MNGCRRETGRLVRARQLVLAATSGRSPSLRKFPVSGRPRQHAKVAVAVDAGRRDESSEAIEELKRRQDLRATASGARFRAADGYFAAVESRLSNQNQPSSRSPSK
jgi:hypothetical protein